MAVQPKHETASTSRRRWLHRLMWLLALVVLVWLTGGLIYGRIILARRAAWEESIEWDDDGIRAGCREYTVGEGSTALLLVHGFADSPNIWQKLAPALAERGYTCRAMRLPGFAERGEAYSQSTRDGSLAAIQAEVDALRKTHRRVVLVGHSLGGALATNLVLDEPTAADALVVVAPLVEVNDQRSPILSSRGWFELLSRLLVFSRVIESTLPLDAHSDEARAYDTVNPFVPVGIYRLLFETVDALEGRSGELTLPLLVVLARQDEIVDSQVAAAYFDQAASPSRQIVWVEQSGHVAPIDTGWESIAESIDQFARSLERPADDDLPAQAAPDGP